MSLLYSALIWIVEKWLLLYARVGGRRQSKLRHFALGQDGLLASIAHGMDYHPKHPVIWFHVASLGEFAVARPLIKGLKQQMSCTIVVTCFSPTGVEALEQVHPNVDYLFYLPLDTRYNARQFLDIVKPDRAVFIISEYWHNYLRELKRRGIPTFLVSAIIRRQSPFFKWWGRLYRRALKTYDTFFVLDEASRDNLHALGYDNVRVVGDPLFDNAVTVARTPWHNDIVERFAAQGRIFLAGSIHDKTDFQLMTTLANRHPDTRFIMVPHEISEKRLRQYAFAIKGEVKFYSQCTADTDFSRTQVLVIDFMGALAYIYRYASWAYVGGGFTPYLHSIIEATVYGVPVAFGPQTGRKVTPDQIVKRGLGAKIRSVDELDKWFCQLRDNPMELEKIRVLASGYVDFNCGSASTIIDSVKRGV